MAELTLSATTPTVRAPRIPAVDAVRGLAVVAMVLYHFLWDTTFFGLTRLDLFGDPAWLAYRTVVLCVFLGLVGISLVLAADRGLTPRSLARRVLLLASCAAAITVTSWFLFPEAPIFFGVLHHIAVASVLGFLCLALPTPILLAAAAAALAAPYVANHAVFDSPWLQWIGLVTKIPRSNDYVPVLPWFGAVLVGLAAGRLVAARAVPLSAWQPASWPIRSLVWTGRHSLFVYMVHQPVLIGLLAAFVFVTGVGSPFGGGASQAPEVPVPAQVEGFLGSCQRSCESNGGNLSHCAGYCRCMVDRLTADGLWQAFMDNRLGDAGQARLTALVHQCVQDQIGN